MLWWSPEEGSHGMGGMYTYQHVLRESPFNLRIILTLIRMEQQPHVPLLTSVSHTVVLCVNFQLYIVKRERGGVQNQSDLLCLNREKFKE